MTTLAQTRPSDGRTGGTGEPIGGRIADRYRVDDVLARGGSGALYLVTDEATQLRLALKRLVSGVSADRVALVSFEREFETLVGLRHPCIIEVRDYGVDDRGPYYTMELLDGQDLQEMAPLPYQAACRYIRDVASSLALLHARRLVHRDVSSRNVRVTSDGRCKLIDFGALVPFGYANHVVGTPTFVAPEACLQLPLDERVDLYSLGAVAYWLLTRRHARPARRFADLPSTWTVHVEPPSKWMPAIPKALDDLVLSLLACDRLARPTTAAEVISRLTAIARLEPEEAPRIVDGYLRSSPLVGRHEEMQTLRAGLQGAMLGRGTSVWVEGATGTGKSRLLKELWVSAKLAGALAIVIAADSAPVEFGGARDAVLRLFEVAPGPAMRLSAPHAASLAFLGRAVRKHLEVAQGGTWQLSDERRGEVQAALRRLFLDVAAERPLVVVVDAIERLDRSSARWLAEVVQEASSAPLFVVAAARTHRASLAPDSLEAIRVRSGAISLSGLRPEHADELGKCLFGDVPNIARFSGWLHRQTAGNPFHYLQLARHLVSKGAVQYVAGTWVLPEDPPAVDLPEDADATLLSSLSSLSPRTMRLLRTLSLSRAPLDAEVAGVIADPRPNGTDFGPLEELVREGVLDLDSGSYRFRHPAVRVAVARSLPGDEARAAHERLGRALLRSAVSERFRAQAAWHLINGGSETEGAELLSQVARTTRFVRVLDGALHTMVPAFEATLRVFKRRGRSRYEVARLLAVLAQAGYYVDRRLALEYGEEALALLLELSGVTSAARASRWVGARVGVRAGLATAKMRTTARNTEYGDYRFAELIADLLGTVTCLCGVATLCLDAASARRHAALLAPLAATKHPVARGVSEYCNLLVLTAEYRLSGSRARWREMLRRFSDRNTYRELPEEARRLYIGGGWYALGVLECLRDSPEALKCAQNLESLRLDFNGMVAAKIRFLHHAFRGEMDLAVHHRARVDAYALEFGSSWQVDVWSAVAMTLVFAALRDVVGLKWVVERLRTLAQELPDLKRHAELARAEYLLMQGDPAEVVEILQGSALADAPLSHVGWAGARGVLATAHNFLGNHLEARDVCAKSLALLSDEDRSFVTMTVRLETQLAIADAALGNPLRAAKRLDRLIELYQSDRGPVTMASLHYTRAQVAAVGGDDLAFLAHSEQTKAWARATQHASFIAYCDGLDQQRYNVLDVMRTRASQPTLPGPNSVELARLVGELSRSPEPGDLDTTTQVMSHPEPPITGA